jgi:NAD(P)-dependent dehydrogenase (short-subunit alcohol dehydrogenase family)
MSKPVMLITGASRGIGAQIALKAAKAGYRVGVNYVQSEAQANQLVEQIRHGGGEAVALKADVAKLDEVVAMFAKLDAHFGPLNVLVNNAGKVADFRVDAVDEHNVSDLFAGNVFSVYYCSREAVRRMSTRHGGQGGVIINMSSVAARTGGLPGGAAYAATKGAIDSFNMALAKEVGAEGIRVVAIRPGLISTEIHNIHGGIEKMQVMAKAVVPMARAGDPAEVADAAIWLASEQASYVHGTTVDVAGGR